MGFGDELITSGLARRAQRSDARRVRIVDKRGRTRWSEVWRGNPRIVPPGAPARDTQVLVSGPGHRPYIARETRERWFWRDDFVCPVGELHLDAAERARGAAAGRGKVVVEPELKGAASPNKDWGRRRWEALVAALARDGHDVIQLGPPGTQPLPGARHVVTESFRAAAAVLAHARLAVLPEGGLHHAAAALGTPAIVLFGGFISPRQTGYAHQLNLYTGGEPCGMRRTCTHCARAMAQIDVGQVHTAAKALLAVVPEDWADAPRGERMDLQVFVGYDPREVAAYQVCVRSLQERCAGPAPVIGPLLEPHLRASGLYRRRHEKRDGRLWDCLSEAPMSTEFALTRFLVPQLADAAWAIYCDCDFLWRADIARLLALADPRCAVQLVPHEHAVQASVKMDGQAQLPYRRKNWSSLMLWNCRHPANRALEEVVNVWPGRALHGFDWLPDELIGTLPEAWNWLEGHSAAAIDPLAVHYTRGTPDLPGYEQSAYADEWRAVHARIAR